MYKLEKVPDDKHHEKEEEEEYEEDDGYENEDVRMLRNTEIHRQKYQCYTINKWRYTVNDDLVKLVEDKCSVMMEMGGYIKTNGDSNVLTDVDGHRLVKPDY